MRSTSKTVSAWRQRVAIVADEHVSAVEKLQAVYAALVRQLGSHVRASGCLAVVIAQIGPVIVAVDEIRTRYQSERNRHVPGMQKCAA